jgi:hypothetical protein
MPKKRDIPFIYGLDVGREPFSSLGKFAAAKLHEFFRRQALSENSDNSSSTMRSFELLRELQVMTA